ncbi:MAG TPA: Smr/MutS family protein [Candidatus Binataceae bacterium]|nr:Smr/MutS family protein [Candidatus Binataceae bacterium]
MPKKKKSRDGQPKKTADKPVVFSPFKNLKKMLAARVEKPPALPPKQAPKPIATNGSCSAITEVADDDTLLREALAGVRPLDGATRLPTERKVTRAIVSEDDEVVAQLSDLVSGQAPFDVTETDEYVEGMRVGLDPRLLSQLRRGEFAMQSHIDLHGMIQPAAHQALTEFILASVRKGLRSVLVVHGRGLRSPGGRAVLKQAATNWLSHGTIGGHVLAFVTARIHDGGAGAMYVLLRREKQRAPFEILEGAKRR